MNKGIIIGAVIVLLLLLGIGWWSNKSNLGNPIQSQIDLTATGINTDQASSSPIKQNNNLKEIKNMSHLVTIKTNLGEIKFITYDADAPKTVENFITLAQKNFYDGVIFHRVIDGFMIQGGDPTGTGTGGPGYTFADELNPTTPSYQEGYKKGIVAMANAGPNTNGSQFFIMVADVPLDKNYTIFGKVIAGQEIAEAIAKVKTGMNDKPLSPVVMEKVTISEYNNQ